MAEKLDPRHAAKLENPERLAGLPPARLVQLLQLTGAETVVDFGAGAGMYSLPIAESLPHGTLYAIDEQQALLDRLRQRLSERRRPAASSRCSTSLTMCRCPTAPATAFSWSTSCTTSTTSRPLSPR